MKTDQLSIYLTVLGVITVANGYAASELREKEDPYHDANELLIDNILKNQHQSNLHLYIEITYLKHETLKDTGRDNEGMKVLNQKDENKSNFNKKPPILQLRANKLFQRVLRDDENDDEDVEKPSKETTTTTSSSSYGGWGFPSMSTLKSLASSAYASLPSKATVSSYVVPGVKTVASYLPASVQSYLPSAETVESYLPSMEMIKGYIPSPTEYIAQNYLGGFNPTRYLGPNRTEQLVNVMSEKILSGEKRGNITDIVDGIGQNLTQRAINSASPALLRMVIHKVVYAMAVTSVGPIAAFLAKNKIAQMADVIAEKAEVQCLSHGICSFDVYSYLKNMHWGDIARGVFQIAKRTMGTISAGGDTSGETTTAAGHTSGGTTVNEGEMAHTEEHKIH